MKLVKAIGWTMISTGSLILLFLGYQLLFTNLLTARAQNQAESELAQLFEEARIAPSEAVVIEPDVTPSTGSGVDNNVSAVEPIDFYPETAAEVGQEFGRISIPKVGLDVVVFEGVDRETLKNGPGHMPWTPLPGQAGNAVVSGHRTTYGAPFFNLNELEAGDEIRFESVVGEHVYVVRETRVVQPDDVWVTNERAGAWLTLTTCHPRFSASQRLIIVAEMVSGPNLEYAHGVKEGLIEAVSS
jgi:sortase A